MIYLLGNSGVVLEERDVTKIEQVQTRVRGGGRDGGSKYRLFCENVIIE